MSDPGATERAASRFSVVFAGVALSVAGLTWAIKDPLISALGLSIPTYSHPLLYGLVWFIHTMIAAYVAAGGLLALILLVGLWTYYTRMEKK